MKITRKRRRSYNLSIAKLLHLEELQTKNEKLFSCKAKTETKFCSVRKGKFYYITVTFLQFAGYSLGRLSQIVVNRLF